MRSSERIPPKRRKSKRSVWRRKIMPLVTLLSVVILCVMAVSWVVGRAWRPVKLYSREYNETKILASQVADIKKENADLQRRINYLKTGAGSAQAARKLGWVKPGEITLVLPEDRYSR